MLAILLAFDRSGRTDEMTANHRALQAEVNVQNMKYVAGSSYNRFKINICI